MHSLSFEVVKPFLKDSDMTDKEDLIEKRKAQDDIPVFPDLSLKLKIIMTRQPPLHWLVIHLLLKQIYSEEEKKHLQTLLETCDSVINQSLNNLF